MSVKVPGMKLSRSVRRANSRMFPTIRRNIFPSGIVIGKVSLVTTDNFDLAKVIKVKSDTNFDDISYVTVVMRGEK